MNCSNCERMSFIVALAHPLSAVRWLVPAFMILVGGLIADAEARTWTDVRGNQSSGEFVRVVNGMVQIRRGNKVLNIAAREFCRR